MRLCICLLVVSAVQSGPRESPLTSPPRTCVRSPAVEQRLDCSTSTSVGSAAPGELLTLTMEGWDPDYSPRQSGGRPEPFRYLIGATVEMPPSPQGSLAL